MELPSLHRLSLDVVVAIGTKGGGADGGGPSGLPAPAPAPEVRRTIDKDKDKKGGKKRITLQPVAREDRPRLLCLQISDADLLNAALLAYQQMLQQVEQRQPTLEDFQLTNEEDAKRVAEELRQGKDVSAVRLVRLPEGTVDRSEPFKAVLAGIVKGYATALACAVFDEMRGLGFATTFLNYYDGDGGNYNFHVDMETNDLELEGAIGSKDWLMLTLVCYLLDDSDGDAPAGQGSTLYNLVNCAEANPETRTAYCPLRNGLITVFAGTDHHSVGPNFGVKRGTVIYKAVLYTPGAKERVSSIQAWWDKVDRVAGHIERGAPPFKRVPWQTIKLCDALAHPQTFPVSV